MKRNLRRAAGSVLAASLLLGLFGGTIERAGAAFPGGNGKIAFTTSRDGNQEIYVMNPDGSDQTNLTQHPAHDASPAWSPDGSRIAFATSRHGGTNYEIYAMNADGSGLTRLTNNTWNDGSPSWSPDGSRIAFASNTASGISELFVMNADGSNPTQLTSNMDFESTPVWSPDGSKIAFGKNAYQGAAGWTGTDIYVMNADGSGATNLTQHPDVDAQPSWSPDGSRIAFVSNRNGAATFGVHLMNADGSGVTKLTQSSAAEGTPDWSPDGSKVSFFRVVSADFSNYDIFVTNADGSAETKLMSEPGVDLAATWQTVPSADLALSLSATPDVARSGKPLTYLVTVKNAGPSNAHEVVVTDALPEGARFVSAQPSKGSCVTPAPGATGVISCAIGFLPNTQDATAAIVVKVVVRKTLLESTATVVSATPDPSPANNTATIATPVR
ncbi:MAG TPA: hypothetical protein VFO64_02210 [Gaiellaceae bacterium]|jgi:uncharacterized repeat protein (TIGR01451 family)|nr:hypothetical protein [Gaiellaceae bacterium]